MRSTGRSGAREVGQWVVAALAAVATVQANVAIAQVVLMSKGTPPSAGADAASYSRFPVSPPVVNARSTVSRDGSFVVFVSEARKAYPDQVDSAPFTDVFLYDRTSDKVSLVSRRNGSVDVVGDGPSDQPVISPDGEWVAFRSSARDLIPGTSLDKLNIYVWQRRTGNMFLASHTRSGLNDGGNGDSQNPVISDQGFGGNYYVAFESVASDLLDTDSNGASDVFRYIVATAINLDLVSVSSGGVPGDDHSTRPAITGSGVCVAFESLARNLVSKPDTNGLRDVFRWSLGDTRLISHRWDDPDTPGDRESIEPSIANNCEQIAFLSAAGDLVATADGAGFYDVFLSNGIGPQVVELVSRKDGSVDAPGDGDCQSPFVSRDSRSVVYASRSSNLVAGQVDQAPAGAPTLDVFLFDAANDKTFLVSHKPGDPASAVGADPSVSSLDPRISDDGAYVAYTSNSRDVADNQLDGLDKDDVFLYNRNLDYTAVASRRRGGVFYAGNDRSDTPSISGDGFIVAFQSVATDLIVSDLNGSIQDAFVFGMDDIPFFTVTSKDGQNTLEWLTPPVGYFQTVVRSIDGGGCPGGPAAGLPVPVPNPGPQAKGLFVDPTPNGTVRCYSAFVQRDAAGTIFSPNPGKQVKSRPAAVGPVGFQWSFSSSAVVSITQPGIGTNAVYSASNDGGLYAITPGSGAAGGLWPGTWWPLRVGVVNSRPPVLPFGFGGAARVVYVGTQEGHIAAINGDKGSLAGGPLWQVPVGQSVTPAPVGWLAPFGGLDFILAGALNAAPPHTFNALRWDSGALVAPSGSFSDPGMGLISGTASVDYPNQRVYSASRQLFGGAPTLFGLKMDAGGLTLAGGWQQALGNLNGSPTFRANRVYIGHDGTNTLEARDAADGTLLWSSPVPFGVKGYAFPDRGGSGLDLYFSDNAVSTTLVHGLIDNGGMATALPGFPIGGIMRASIPVFVRLGPLQEPYLYVGDFNGNLVQIKINTPPPHTVTPLPLPLTSPGQIGAPSFDVFSGMIYVGSETGQIFAVKVPF